MRYQRAHLAIEVDSKWYLATYPQAWRDIQQGKYRSAIDHYISIGIRNGFLPSEPDVDEEWYRHHYPDVSDAILRGVFSSGKDHFIRCGYRGGRLAKPFQAWQTQTVERGGSKPLIRRMASLFGM